MSETEQNMGGSKVYVVGAIERWVIVTAAGALVTGFYLLGQYIVSSLDQVQTSTARIELAQAVGANELQEVKAKQQIAQQELSKIPKLEIQVQQNTTAIEELRRVRGLK